jgi:hypothetical protein
MSNPVDVNASHNIFGSRGETTKRRGISHHSTAAGGNRARAKRSRRQVSLRIAFRYCQLGKRLENDGVSVPPYADSQRKISSLDVETEHV